jgi:hypothetical protein
MKNTICYLFVLLLSLTSLSAQSNNFNLNAYSNYLQAHQNFTTQELLSQYDAGKFALKVKNFPSNVLYLDSLKLKFKLTNYENGLLSQNEFFVTERIMDVNFLNMYQRIWKSDLPLFISTDAVLNAFHRSYDLILKETEIIYLIPKLDELLTSLCSKIPDLESKYSKYPELATMLKDVDVYLTVPRKLLNSSVQPYYSENNSVINDYLSKIEALNAEEVPVFSTNKRNVDFSQFKPRGHYTDNSFPQLAKYFKAMIWLGRIELYLIAPVSGDLTKPSKQDVQRQIIDSYLIADLVSISSASGLFNEIEKTIASFVGEQDNVTLTQFNLVKSAVGITAANNLLDTIVVKKFQDTLDVKPYAGQKILSQLLASNPMDPGQIEPASAFLLFGQRFVMDSYVTGSVIFDRIKYNDIKMPRMLPSTLDVLFALGNSAAGQLLKPEIDTYKYAANLSALRYLVDSYQQDFWNSSIYNLWLNSLRALNPPDERVSLPQFMQTASWWQQKMNTQLASWAELRHDNILYAKQSYTGMITCSFPYCYVEPFPQFYSSMKDLALKTVDKFNSLSIDLSNEKNYLNGFANLMDTLKSVAEKELNKTELSENETKFLKKIFYSTPMCGNEIDGWYAKKLIYNSYRYGSSSNNYVVADYHTSPTDELGNMVGWVKHSGTGPANLCIVIAELPNVGNVAFAGPVSSYYEYTSTNFQRLTDEEWNQTYLGKSLRPDWVNVYLANSTGETRGAGSMLVTGIDEKKETSNSIPADRITIQNYPNPFNMETIISFTVPVSLSNSFTELVIYNINGETVKKLISKELTAGNYLTRWDGTNNANNIVASGIYFYTLKVSTRQVTGKMNLLK